MFLTGPSSNYYFGIYTVKYGAIRLSNCAGKVEINTYPYYFGKLSTLIDPLNEELRNEQLTLRNMASLDSHVFLVDNSYIGYNYSGKNFEIEVIATKVAVVNHDK